MTLQEAATPLVLDDEIRNVRVNPEQRPAIIMKPSAVPDAASDMSALRVGDEVLFGHFPCDASFEPKLLAWRVLNVRKDRVLLLTRNAIIPVTKPLRYGGEWAQSPVRRFLNTAFLDCAFSQAEREQILATDVPGNSKTDGPTTKDRVFLLDEHEVGQCMRKQKQRKARATEYCWLGVAFSDPLERVAWDLRTPGADNETSCRVTESGYVDRYPHTRYSYSWSKGPDRHFLRPAIWVRRSGEHSGSDKEHASSDAE